MYCAYTIPGMTGSSLMYYYNGKAVRKHFSVSFPVLCEGLGVRRRVARACECVCVCVCVRERGREREREKKRVEV